MSVPEWVSAKSLLRPVPSSRIVTEKETNELKEMENVVIEEPSSEQRRRVMPRTVRNSSLLQSEEISQEPPSKIPDPSLNKKVGMPLNESVKNQTTKINKMQLGKSDEHSPVMTSIQSTKSKLVPDNSNEISLARNEINEQIKNNLEIQSHSPNYISHEKYDKTPITLSNKNSKHQSSVTFDHCHMGSPQLNYVERNNHSNSWHTQEDDQDMIYSESPTNQRQNASKGKDLIDIECMLWTLLKRSKKCDRSNDKKKRFKMCESSESSSSGGESDLERKRKEYESALNDYCDTKRANRGEEERKISHRNKRNKQKSRHEEISSSSDDCTIKDRRKKTRGITERAFTKDTEYDDYVIDQRNRKSSRDSHGKYTQNSFEKKSEYKEKRKSREDASDRYCKGKRASSTLDRKLEAFEKAKRDLCLAKEAAKRNSCHSLSASSSADLTEFSSKAGDTQQKRRSKHSDEYSCASKKKDSRRSISCDPRCDKAANREIPKLCTSCISINSLTSSQKQALCYIQKAFAFSNVCHQSSLKPNDQLEPCPVYQPRPSPAPPLSSCTRPTPPQTVPSFYDPGPPKYVNHHHRMTSDCQSSRNEAVSSCKSESRTQTIKKDYRQIKNDGVVTKRYSGPYSELPISKTKVLKTFNYKSKDTIIEESENEYSDVHDDSVSSESKSGNGEATIRISYGKSIKKNTHNACRDDDYMKDKLNDILEQTVRLQKTTEQFASCKSQDYAAQCYIPVCCPRNDSHYPPQATQMPLPQHQAQSYHQNAPTQHYQTRIQQQYPLHSPQPSPQPFSPPSPQPYPQPYTPQSSLSHYPPSFPPQNPPPCPLTCPSQPLSYPPPCPQSNPSPCPPPCSPPCPPPCPQPCLQQASSANCKECNFNFV